MAWIKIVLKEIFISVTSNLFLEMDEFDITFKKSLKIFPPTTGNRKCLK